MSNASQSELIIKQSIVEGIKNAFVLGCTERRVTFNSQQIRAFNLVWALFDQRIMDETSKVGIVGGGLSGMTVAAALNLKGCKAMIFHEGDELMDMQRGNISRFIHPNIYDWPHDGCEIEHTDLPCLNWRAGNAEEVAMQIEEHWDDLNPPIPVRINTRISKIGYKHMKTRVYIADSADNEPFDCVILAVGFGVEKNLPNTQIRSYWDNDNFTQSNKTRMTKIFLVSGCGDGGLIDALRARLVNFKHGEFTRSLLANRELMELKDTLLEIESKAPVNPEEFSNHIFDSYKSLSIPLSILEYVKTKLRSKTKVIIHGRLSTVMSSKACLFNRFCIFLLINLEDVTYIQGEINSAILSGGKYQVEIIDDDISKTVNCDELIIRHGPISVVKDLIGSCELPEANESVEIVEKLWEKDFYPETKEEINDMSEAYKNLASFQRKIKKIDNMAMVSVEKQKSVEVYAVYSGKYQNTQMSSIIEFKGIKVLLADNPLFSLSSASNRPYLRSAILSPGSSIGYVGGTIGTLGCFVYTENHKIGFLSCSHVLQSKHSSGEIYFQGGQDKNRAFIGKLYKSTALIPVKDNKRPRNVVDAAVAVLNSGINFQKTVITDKYDITLKGAGIARIGDTVKKFGAETGLTKGEVKALHCSLTINQDNQAYYFEEAILVKSDMHKPFARAGDSGAIVFRSDGRVLGMVFATSSEFTVICPIKEVLESLNCNLLT